MAVVVDAQPDHVPAGVIAVADPENRKLRLVDRFPGAPVKRERAPLRVDVAAVCVRNRTYALKILFKKGVNKWIFFLFQKYLGTPNAYALIVGSTPYVKPHDQPVVDLSSVSC